MKTYNGSEEQRKEIEECDVLVVHFMGMAPIYTTDKPILPSGARYECLHKKELEYRMTPHDKETTQ
jgi:hypothetical protein